MLENLIFANKSTHVTENDLNAYFGAKGRSFKEFEDAVNHKASLKRKGIQSYITRLRNYRMGDVCLNPEGRGLGIVKKGAEDYTVGFLVTVLTNNN